MDIYSKKIIEYAYGKSMSAELAVKAVKNDCLNVKNTKGILLHSDLGTQYTSQLFEDHLCKKHIRLTVHIVISISWKSFGHKLNSKAKCT